MGKIIGGGLPLGAVGGRNEYLRLNEEGQVYHSGTHHGHPLATIAGIATLEVMDRAAYARLNGYAESIKTAINTWAAEKSHPFVVFGAGSHLGYEFTDQPGRAYRSCRDILAHSNETRMQTYAFEMANRGIFPTYRGQIALSEPMTEHDIDRFVAVTKDVVGAILEA